jgi:hypothetical protein
MEQSPTDNLLVAQRVKNYQPFLELNSHGFVCKTRQ